MERSGSSGSGVDKLLAQIKAQWTPERHERVFAAIVERIRADGAEGAEDEEDDVRDDDDDHRAGYSQLEGGHTHA